MSSKHFKRKLKTPKFGFRYYRIWGQPLEAHNVTHHQDSYGKNPNYSIFKHPVFGWLSLCVYEEFVKYPKYKMLCGSLGDRYFNKHQAALNALADYTAGRTHEGLSLMCEYHHDLDRMDEAMGICDRGLGGFQESNHPEDEYY